ncbi:MAG: hypothetical protein ACK4GK_15715 [Ferrovibrio sp.]
MSRTFYVGLTMAGAISAGAYNAGVFDFLMEALEAWEKKRGQPGIPDHRVVIAAVSGASAGGITGALGLATLIKGFSKEESEVEGLGKVQYFMPQMYQTWVVRPRFVSLQNGRSLLDTKDLDADCGADGSSDHNEKLPKTRGVRSLLDATALDWIAEEGLKLQPDVNFKPLPYIAEDLDLFLTLTNLRGVPYSIKFSGQPAGGQNDTLHGMLLHGDRAHFRIAEIGMAETDGRWAKDEPAITMRPSTLNPASVTREWRNFAEAAKATGAFPIGLRSRYFAEAVTTDWRKRQWTVKLGDLKIEPKFPVDRNGQTDYPLPFATVDGGAIDNEPFQLARWAIMKPGTDENERNQNMVDRAVIMVDPFPEAPAFDPAEAADNRLTAVAGRLPGVLINQARFKLNDMIDALQEDVLSRFLISPRRSEGGVLQTYGIACGLMGGFGGFLDEAFRAHDYQLGRRNCQAFLREAFALPRENKKIFPDAEAEKYDPAFTASNPDPSKTAPADRWYQIIPLMPELQAKIELPPWPRIPMSTLTTFVERAMLRADKLVDVVLREQVGSWIFRQVISIAWSWGLDGKVRRTIRDVFLKDLILRNQISVPAWDAAIDKGLPGRENETPESRATRELRRGILAALADGKYDLRTTPGIVWQLRLDPAKTREVADFLETLGEDIVWRGPKSKAPKNSEKHQTYTLDIRKPDMMQRSAITRWIGKPLFGELSIDLQDMPS